VGDPCEAPGCGGLHHDAAVRGVGSRREDVGLGVYGRRKGAVGSSGVRDGDVLVAFDVGYRWMGADLGEGCVGE
jgi:hypothetical protein